MRFFSGLILILFLVAGSSSACPSCAGNLPPDEDGTNPSGGMMAYNISIGMLLGVPVCLVTGIGVIVRRQLSRLTR
ncbi:MAG: hypothetical protein DWH82_01350 [Planctomycetota bacterium]|nr:MAG: hypothetical protein DWH82_01350 [Planctomycetota bacterium]